MLRRLRQSLFAKLTLVVLAAAVAVIIILVLAIGEAIRQGRNPQLWGPVDGFVKFTAEQIFAAPSAAAIDAAAARLGMRIRYQGPDFAYATDDSLPAFDEMRRHRHAHRRARGRGVVMDFEDGAQYLMHARPPHRILLVSALRGSQEVHAGWIIAAALGLAGISHELRTPLARMKVAVEFVSDARIQKRLTEDIDELDSLTGDLLESARLASKHGNLQTAPCGAAQLARDTVAQLDAAAQQYFRVQDHSAGAVIDADARRLRRALRNILDNSLKYSQLAPASIAVTIARAAGRVTITVQDRGPGIARPDLARIFDAFYRADPSRARAADTPGGYGLGMGLCRAIVEAHHGAVTAASAPGEGVRVTVELPAGRQETCHTPA